MPDQPALTLLTKRELQNFSSASSIEFYNGRLYVTGDDSRTMLVLDASYSIVDSIELFPGTSHRIPKKEKNDLEASAILHLDKKDYLLVAGSASTPEREVFFLFPMDDTRKYETFPSTHFIDSLKEKGLDIINIEGLATYGEQLIFANRANFGNPFNHLVIIDGKEIRNPLNSPLLIKILLEADRDIIQGISGLTYIESHDLLLFTASVEHTANAIDDGSIGDSYLGYIMNFSSKVGGGEIRPDEFMNLSQMHTEFAGEKIESVCVESAAEKIILHLVADNDDGTSTVFRLSLVNPSRQAR